MKNNLCKICNSDLKEIFKKDILGKYNVTYYQCLNCGFLQTEKPYWLGEAYSSAITSLDVGMINRNIKYADIIEDILYSHFNKKGKLLDFAGGYGMFTRIMRDKGFDFYHYDRYCDNIFAKHFTLDDLSPKERKFELVTAFELMEHVEDPAIELNYIFSMTDSFLFSTELVPDGDLENWWYLGSEHGQHISFYSSDSIKGIAKKYNKEYYTNGYMHLLTNKKGLDAFGPKKEKNWLSIFIRNKISFFQKLPSKTQEDFNYIKKKQKGD